MKNIYLVVFSAILGLLSVSAYAQPGGATCASAAANPITLPFSASGLTNCGSGNDYTSSNSVACGSNLYYGGEDRLYAFTPTTSGSITITMSSTSSWAGLFLFLGCPTSGTCIGNMTGSSGSPTLTATVTAGQTYYIMIDSWPTPNCHPSYSLSVTAPNTTTTTAVTADDCSDAVNICTNASFAIDPNGYGQTQELPSGSTVNPSTNPASSNSGCLLTGETNSTWMIVNIASSGTLQFSFGSPNVNSNCYDWIMFPYTAATCGQIASNAISPVRCNWNGSCGGFTGIASPLPTGGVASNFEPPLNVTCGQQYLICLSNYSSASTNVPLNFFGTATVSCTTVAPLTVNSATICQGNSTTLTATGTGFTSYSWTPAGTLSASTGASVTANPTVTTTYTVTGTGSCATTTATATVTVTQGPTLTATSTPASCSACNGTASVTASAGGGGPYTYSWAPSGGTGATVSNLCAGTYTVTVAGANSCTRTQTVTVTSTSSITVNTTHVNVSCNGQSNGTATATPSGGTAPYTYSWSPSGQTTQTATGLTAGSYTVTVTSANGCSSTATVTITQPTALTTTGSQVNITCNPGNNGSATVTASGGTPGYTYSWAPSGGTGATASNIAAGNYTVTVTDAAGCIATRTYTITQPTAITLTTSSNAAMCGNNNGSASVTASGGTPGYTYSWAPSGGTTANAANLSSGSYTVTVTDAAGCIKTANVTVNSVGGATTTITSTTNVSCNGGNNGSATTSVSGGTSPYTYAWSPSGGTGSVGTGLAAGNYTVTVTDAMGCVSSATTTITQSAAISTTGTQTNVLCNGGTNGSATVTASGGTTPYTYAWTPSGGTGATASNLAAGNYTVTVTDAGGCTVTRTYTITQPAAASTTGSQVNVTCNGGTNGSASVTINGGTSPYTYAWTPSGGTGATASNLAAGNYTVTVTDANGCIVTRTYTITQPTAVTGTTTATQATCNSANGSVTVTPSGGTGPYTFAWAPSGGTGSTASGLNAGTYTVTITDASGCQATATATVGNSGAPTASVVSSTNVTCFGANNGSITTTVSGGTAPLTYAWTPSGGTNASATGLGPATYTLTVTDASGCTATATATITQPTALTASITSSTNVSCFGGNNGSATVAASGGTTPYTYAWTPSGGTNASATGLTAASYTVTVTDAHGCTATATVNITQPPQLTLSIAGFDATCNGVCDGQAVVIPGGGTSPYSYSWSPVGGTNPSANGLCAGTYTVLVTDANGCTLTANTTVNEPAAIVLTTTSTPSNCNQPDGTAGVTVTGGTGPYSYSWTPSAQTTATATGLTPNQYCVTVTDFNGCTASVCVTVANAPGVTASVGAVTSVTCNNACDGTAAINAAGGTGPYTYTWLPSGSGANATGLCAGTYTVTVSDVNNCSATVTLTITQPAALVITPSQNVTICTGQCTTLSATTAGGTSPYTYAWTPGGPNVCPTSTTVYSVTSTDQNGCASAPATVTVTVNPPLNVTAAGATTICPGGQATLTANGSGGNGNITYTWIPGNLSGSSVTVSPAATTTYSVIVSDGCTVLNDTDVVTVTVAPVPVVNFTSDITGGCTPVCINFSDLTTVASGTVTAWQWDFGDGNTSSSQDPQHCYSTPGTYTISLIATSSNGCTQSLVIANMINVYSLPVPEFEFGPQPTTILNSQVCFTDGSLNAASWSWDFGDPTDITTSLDQNPCHTYQDTGTFCVTLTITNANGCDSAITHCLIISPEFTFWIPNAFSPNNDGVNDGFGGRGIFIHEYEMYIFDRWGNMIFYSDDINDTWDGKANHGSQVAQEDVYVYKVVITDIFEKKHTYLGHVTLIK